MGGAFLQRLGQPIDGKGRRQALIIQGRKVALAAAHHGHHREAQGFGTAGNTGNSLAPEGLAVQTAFTGENEMIMDAMEECIAENVEESDKDKKVLEKVNKVAEKAKELALELHRKVTAAELSEETGMSEKAIRDAMRISGYAIEDLEG